MKTDSMEARSDHEVARVVAQEAAGLLLDIRASGAGRDAGQLRDDGDASSHNLIMQRLAELRPQDAVLSEEGRDDRARLGSRRVWVIDPLDGTREFGEPPRDDWAVHVALCVDGTAVVGAVALPAQGKMFATGQELPTIQAATGRPRIVASRTRAPELVSQVMDSLGGEMVHMGSAGAKAMAVLSGDADIYLHAGGQYEWDSAAPVAVAAEAGLHCSRIDGSPLRYNRTEPYLPDLLICKPELAGPVFDALRAVGAL